MSYLLKWQFISLISRILAMLLGIIQSIVIVNVLPTGDYGAIKVVASIASIIGVSQALGLTSGSTREISGAKDKGEAFKVFITSLILRNFISLPFVLFLFLAAPKLATNRENFNDVVWALRIMSITLLIQTSQGIFNSVLSGFRKFRQLFIFQVAIAAVSVSLYIPLVYIYSFKGYYYAYISFNIVSAIILSILALRCFDGKFPKFTFIEMRKIAKEVFSISIAVYIVKLLYTLWLEGPVLFLEYFKKEPAVIPLFSVGLLFATKLLVFSDSITDVTLPVMSKKFSENIEEFKTVYKSNFQKTILIITIFSAGVAFWGREILQIARVKSDYSFVPYIIPFLVLGVWSYSNLDLLKSSIFIPAKKLMYMVFVFSIMPILIYFLFIMINYYLANTLISLSASFGLGSFIALAVGIYLVYREFSMVLINKLTVTFITLSFLFASSFYLVSDLFIKITINTIYAIICLYYLNNSGVLDFVKVKFKNK